MTAVFELVEIHSLSVDRPSTRGIPALDLVSAALRSSRNEELLESLPEGVPLLAAQVGGSDAVLGAALESVPAVGTSRKRLRSSCGIRRRG